MMDFTIVLSKDDLALLDFGQRAARAQLDLLALKINAQIREQEAASKPAEPVNEEPAK